MKTMKRSSRTMLFGVLGGLVSLSSCSDSDARVIASIDAVTPNLIAEESAETTVRQTISTESLTDKELTAVQDALIDLAFKTASALPHQPHIKNRSRAQEAVVTACFELGQPQRALEYIEQIDNWRRGQGYADYAAYCVERGASDVEEYLALAGTIAESDDAKSGGGWRRDRIRVKIARVHRMRGDAGKAAEWEQGLVDSEFGKSDDVKMRGLDDEAFLARLDAIQAAAGPQNFDRTKNLLQTCTEMYDEFYEDRRRRTEIEKTIKTSWEKLPILVRVELMLALSESAYDHGNQDETLRLVKDAQVIMESVEWTTDYSVPLLGRLARLRFLGGDREMARRQVDAALSTYAADRSKVADIYWARTLRPVAQALHAMGDVGEAMKIYKEAVEAGMANPNSRPRAQDLTATCLAMALDGFEPDAELSGRLNEIYEGLGSPW